MRPEAVHDLVLGRALGAGVHRDAQATGRGETSLRHELWPVCGPGALVGRRVEGLVAARIDDRVRSLGLHMLTLVEIDRETALGFGGCEHRAKKKG